MNQTSSIVCIGIGETKGEALLGIKHSSCVKTLHLFDAHVVMNTDKRTLSVLFHVALKSVNKIADRLPLDLSQ